MVADSHSTNGHKPSPPWKETKPGQKAAQQEWDLEGEKVVEKQRIVSVTNQRETKEREKSATDFSS